eukprot:COSAG06_NODE_5722_length_3306_cov_1.883692_3_plen_164_part_00
MASELSSSLELSSLSMPSSSSDSSEMLDWVSARANEAMEEWVGDSVLPQNLVTDAFNLGRWEPVRGHGGNPFVPTIKGVARLRHLVPDTVSIVGPESSKSRETLSLVPERPKRDCDPDEIEPGQLGYGRHLSSKQLAADGGIRPYAPRHVQYDTWYEGILCGK